MPMVSANGCRPIAVIVMEEGRRHDVYPPHVRARLDQLVAWAHVPMTREELYANPSTLGSVEYLFLGWGAPRLDEDLLAHAPSLRLVAMAAGTIRDVVTPAFWARGVPIVSAAAANAIPVADFTVAQIILALKNSQRISRELKDSCVAPSRTRIPGAYRRRIGLLSLGSIGQLVAQRLSSFDLEVDAYDPTLDDSRARKWGVSASDIESIFAHSDVVSCHVPLLPQTRGLVGGTLLNSMKRGATLINTARGAVIDEDALAAVLRNRPDLTALLDVTVEEPLALSSPLRSLPNVFLTGHSAGSQGRECWRLGELVLEEFERHRAGEPLIHAVSEAVERTRA